MKDVVFVEPMSSLPAEVWSSWSMGSPPPTGGDGLAQLSGIAFVEEGSAVLRVRQASDWPSVSAELATLKWTANGWTEPVQVRQEGAPCSSVSAMSNLRRPLLQRLLSRMTTMPIRNTGV